MNKTRVRSATVRGYAEAINTLFVLRGFRKPVDFDDPNNMVALLASNLKKEEDVANQRSPLDNQVFAKLQEMAIKSKSPDSAEAVLFNTVALGRITGHRLSEYAQNKQNKVELHEYPSGRKVIKAFTAEDFIFYDASKNRIEDLNDATLEQVVSMKVTWRIQKNRQNGQSLNIAVDVTNPTICPVRNAATLVLQARRLGQASDMPVAFYMNKNGEKLYLTGGKIATLFRKAVRSCRPSTSKEELTKFSAHSVRVWACVLLDEAGKSAEFIKKQLRWLGDSFRLYLRDTAVITTQHRDALHTSSREVMELINMVSGHNDQFQPPSAIAAESDDVEVPTLVQEDTEMGNYIDEMD